MSKKFWLDVKKTFYEAMEDAPAPEKPPVTQALAPGGAEPTAVTETSTAESTAAGAK